ncbi:MAG TPA: LpqB family beta-propeller domain-containing protein [Gemmatimonadales bacterium]|nr:LpqB family beta-propeller domain-containing protein [Gemmatimonadales bacterium]
MRVPRAPRARRFGPLSLLAALTLAPAVPAGAQTVTEVQVTPETLTLAVGGRQTLFATAYDRQGNLIPNARFTFWSSDTLVAKVGRDGAVMGVGPGLAKVEARVQGLQASTAVLITGPGAGPDTAARPGATVLTLEPASATLLPGEGLLMVARPLREDGTPGLPGRVTWRSLNPGVAAVDSGGVVVAVAPGRTIVQAAAPGGLMATAAVEVAASEVVLADTRLVLGPGEMDTLRATVPGQGGRELRGGIQWVSTDTTVARVGPTGIVSALAPGRAEVIAAGFGQERRAAVLVHREPRSLVVTPPASGPIQVPVRAVRRVTVTAEAADSTPIGEARIAWEVGDTAIVGYDAAKGELAGRAVGTTSLTARLHGFDPVVWTVEVIPGTLGLDRQRLGIGIGERDSLRAVLLDEAGKPAGAPSGLDWRSSDAQVLQVSAGGVIDGLRPGRAVVTVTAPWGKSVAADVFVVADLFLASNRGGAVGLYQLRSTVPDTLRPVLADSSGNIQPALSPDRTRIAFSSNRSGSYDLYLMDADGTNLRRLTTDPGNEGEPVWTPDGLRLIYTGTPKGRPSQLHELRPDGKPPTPLSAEPGAHHSPAVSPDGRTLAFVSTRDGNQEIYVMPLGGGAARRVTRTDQRESHPRFLPGGDLLFAVERGGRSKGSRLVRLSGTEGEGRTVLETDQPIGGLAVSRDGTRIAYVTGFLDARRRARFSLMVQPLAAGAAPTAIVLREGEHVLSPAF